MPKVPLSILFASALCVSAPAGAQISGYGGLAPRSPSLPIRVTVEGPAVPELGWRLGTIRDRIDEARKSGRITRSEARAFRREARMIGTLRERYDHGGISEAEAAELQNRAAYLSDAIAAAPARKPR